MAYQDHAAAGKVALSRRPFAYTVQAMLAGSYIGVAVVLMVSAAGPFLEQGSPATKLVQGLVFGVALTLVYAAGGELVTSNMMTLTQGAFRRAITWFAAARTMLFCFFANMLGAFAFAAMVHLTGLLERGTPAGDMLAGMLEAKSHEAIPELFWRGVLCNMLVCLAIWSTVRLTSEGAKLFVIFWCLLAFITSGFEHVVANMTTFGLGLIGAMPETSWAEFGRNMTTVGLGNLVGGAVVVGLAYAVSASRDRVPGTAAPVAAVAAPAAPASVAVVPDAVVPDATAPAAGSAQSDPHSDGAARP